MESKMEKKNNEGKVFFGRVVSTKMKDTAVVLVERYTKHPKYGKFLRRQKKFKAHDAGNKCHEGEVVEIIETKPISKDKRFKVLEK
jgi:small subunit ribosomal protein S17